MIQRLWCTAILVLAVGCPKGGPASPPPVTIFAAASLSGSRAELSERLERECGVELVASFASSSALEHQIEAGAPCDVFISAAPGNVDRLIAAGLLDGGTRREVARNELVVVVPVGQPAPGELAALAGLVRVAVGQRGVPVGDYAREAFRRAGVEVRAELAGYPDEPAVVAAVAEGAAPAGVVYASSLVTSPRRDRLSRAFAIDAALHEPIVYVAAARPGASPAARAVLEQLARPDVGGVLFAHAGLLAPVAAVVTSRP
jgi:molybdate transport system substrate-binding protein